MAENIRCQFAANGHKYQQSLLRIIQKYSNLPDPDAAIEVDLNNTSTESLLHYMKVSKKMIKAKELDQSQQDGGGDSCQMLVDGDNDDGVSNLHSWESSLNRSQWSIPEFDFLPEDQAKELELNLRSQGSNLSELFPSMIGRIRRARHRWRISDIGNRVLMKYRKWRQQSGRSKRIKTLGTSHRRSTSKKTTKNPATTCSMLQCSSLRDKTLLGMDLSFIRQSPESKRIKVDETFIVAKEPPFALSPSSASSGTLDQPSNPRRLFVSATRDQPSACVFSPSRSSNFSSEASLSRLQRSRRLMGEQPFSCFPSSSGTSSGVSLDCPLSSRRLFSSVDRDQRALGMPSPSRSSDSTANQSPRVKRLCSAPAGEQPSLRGFSPLKSPGQPSSWVLSPQRSSGPTLDQFLRSQRLWSTGAREQPSSWVLSPLRPSTPSSDRSLRSTKFARAAAREQQQQSPRVLSPSRCCGRPKGLAVSAADEQFFASSLQSSGSFSDLSQSSKSLFSPENSKFLAQTDICGFPDRPSLGKVGMVNWEDHTRSQQAFSRSPNPAQVQRYSRSPASTRQRPLTPQPKSCLGSPPQARKSFCQHLSVDSSLTSGFFPYSKKDLDEDFYKHFHKFVCQSKLCPSAEARRPHFSQTLGALALSPHCFKLRKHHRELDWGNLSCSLFSPGSKWHRNEKMRRRLRLPDCEAAECGVLEHDMFRGSQSGERLGIPTRKSKRGPESLRQLNCV
ncbi:uncharacterized protein LOC119128511 [Syngnathus acus]|uniref:uncharacterized protein LOC119128511 n=1 Tax=Syngnathus acus TaxID=161584 RepID=UPI0018861D92|nr:uncharacterized protein LOC119128511 [Syngnathus acus]